MGLQRKRLKHRRTIDFERPLKAAFRHNYNHFPAKLAMPFRLTSANPLTGR
jgi:hypothetical protein